MARGEAAFEWSKRHPVVFGGLWGAMFGLGPLSFHPKGWAFVVVGVGIWGFAWVVGYWMIRLMPRTGKAHAEVDPVQRQDHTPT